MTAESRQLRRLVFRWRIQRSGAWTLATLAVGWGAWQWLGIWAPSIQLFGAVDAAVVTAAIGLLWARRRPLSVSVAALHCDKSIPELEESTRLLLTGPDLQPPLSRLQRRRTAAAFAATEIPPLNQVAMRAGVLTALVGASLGSIALFVPRSTAATENVAETGLSAEAEMEPLSFQEMTIAWQPPRYTGLPRQEVAARNITVEEGSAVEWRAIVPQAEQVWLVDVLGDTLKARSLEGSWLMVVPRLRESRVWRLEASSTAGDTIRTVDRVLTVLRDQPPTIAVVAPPGRTELEWSDPHQVVVRAVVADDYGLVETTLSATVAAGRGEGVRFRGSELTLEVESESSTEQVISRLVDLDSLGVEPGDEVYLVFTARDNKAPTANIVESETVFLSIRDTFDLSTAEFGGVAINVEPDFFRSQRQIILDTEALLRRVRQGTVSNPLPPSAAIGYDQHLLRLRYGEIAGQEDELGVTDPEHDITEEDLRHDHDSEENATLLATSVKATLQRALAEMWEAEKHLRTGDPETALPFEYRALVELERIRQAQRAYVKRVGFAPGPIDTAANRLTRDATELAPLSRSVSAANQIPEAELHAALELIAVEIDPSHRGVLESAGRRLAERTVNEEPGDHLETMAALRKLLDGAGTHATVDVARRGLLSALPLPKQPVVPGSEH